jgi:hypothetical protein
VKRTERELEEEGGNGTVRGCLKTEQPELSEQLEKEAGMMKICTGKGWGSKG